MNPFVPDLLSICIEKDNKDEDYYSRGELKEAENYKSKKLWKKNLIL